VEDLGEPAVQANGPSVSCACYHEDESANGLPRPDGSWKSIRWPLPKGEVRDMPDNALVHVSAIRRMQSNPDYRPGNLILGGGGRGVKKASPEHGIGEWELVCGEGNPIGECYVRKSKKKAVINGTGTNG
jgi:hypothetical protein